MRAWTRAAVVAGLLLAGLVVLPGANAGAASTPAARRDATNAATVTATSTKVPLVTAYPRGVSHAVFLKALEKARASGRMQKQGFKRVHGAMVAASSASGYALPAGPAPAACPLAVTAGAWPNITSDGTTPCYVATYEGAYEDSHPAQDIFPGQSAVLGVTGTPGSFYAGQVVPAAWQLAWNNLFDYEPLMRSSYGQPGNDITGYDTEFGIFPGLDNSSCYGNSGPDGGGYNFGRYQNQCTIVDSAGPYYGTPAGQKVPWTMMTGAIGWSEGGIPAVYNCAATCNPEWVGMQIESPVMLEPSPYAAFGDTIGANNRTVTFTDQTLSDLQITSWNWNFGDGSTSSAQSPVHTYAKGGQYTVTLTVTANGQTSTASTTVTPPGSLTVSATMSPSTIEVGSEDGTIDVTVTNPNKDAVSGLEVNAGIDPLDGSFTTDPTAVCLTNCVDPLPAGATSTYTLGVSGVDQNDPTAADLVSIDADATIDGVDTTGTTNSPVITVNDALTVTSVDPTGGQIYGGDSVTVEGTGFQDLLGADTVTGVDFTDSEGGDQLAATNIDVKSPTELTVDSPDASSLVDPAGTGTFDVVVSTSYAESPLSIDDEYDYGCQTETSTPIGEWQFSGCFNSPKADDYTSTTKATLDGLTVNPAGGSSVVDFDDGDGTLTVPASGNVALTVGGTSTPVCNGPLNWDLTAASVSCPAPDGRVLGLAATGPVTLTPQAGGTVDGSAPVKLPGILGATAGTLKFVVSDGGGLTSASVTAPTAGSIAQLVSAKVTSMNLNVGSGVWSASGTATTSFGGTTALSSTFSYGSTGQLASGSLNLGKVDLAGAVTWSSLALSYSTSTKLWTASPTIENASTGGTVSLAVTDATGALTAGSISTGGINLFGAMPLGSLTLTYGSSSWALATTADDSGDGSVSATFPVTSGQISGATITQDGDPINLYSQLPSNAAVLAYSTAANLPVYTGPLTVDLPGATDTGTPATLTSTNDAAAKIKIALTSQTALFGGVTLTSLSAPVTGPVSPNGTTVCGSAGMNLGPQVGTSNDQIATLKGAMNFTYPTSGNVLYQMLGKLSVPTWKTGAGSLGIASLGLLQGQPTASAKLALGTGTASGTCPLAKLPSPTTLTLKTGVTVSGLLTGTEADADFFFQGPASFAYPAVPLLPAKATGTVVVNEIGLTACANVSGHAGLYGFSMTWAGVFSSYATGNCVLPTTSSGFGCLTQTAAPAGLWQFSGCFSTPASGQFASTLPATLDGLGLNPASGTSTLIDTGAKTATLPSGGTLSVPRGTTSSTLCDGPFSWSLAAATVTCTPPASTRLFGLPVTGAVTLTPKAGGVVDGSAPVNLPGILGAPAGTLSFVVSGAGVLTSASVVPSGSGSIAGLVTGTVTAMTLNVTTGLWTVAGSATTSAGATATLKATVNYDATGNVSVGTLNLGKVDLGGAVTWNALNLTYNTATKLWTGSPVIVGAAAAGSMSLNVADTTGAVTAGSLTTGPVTLFSALPLGSLALTSAGTSWHLTSTPSGAGLGSVSASFPVTAGRLTGATITQSASPIDLYGQLPSSSAVLTYSVVAGAPVYNGTLTVALPGAASTATPGTVVATNDGAAAIKVATTSATSLFGGVNLTSISGTVKAKTATVGTSVCGPTAMTVGPVSGAAQVATLKGGALSFTYPTSGAVPYVVDGKLAIPTWKTGAGSLGIASIALVQGQATGAVTLALGTGTASPACPLAALPAPTALTLKKGVTVNGKLTGTEGASAFFLKGTGTFAYPAATVLPASASGTITVDGSGIAACAAVTGQSGKYGFSMTWAGVFTTFNTGNCVLPTT